MKEVAKSQDVLVWRRWRHCCLSWKWFVLEAARAALPQSGRRLGRAAVGCRGGDGGIQEHSSSRRLLRL